MDIAYKFLPESIKSLPTYVDFKGQQKAEKIFHAVILTFAVLGFGIGYVLQQFMYTTLTLGVGLLVSCAIVVPPWPMYRTAPLKWQPARDIPDTSSPPVSPTKSTPVKDKKKK